MQRPGQERYGIEREVELGVEGDPSRLLQQREQTEDGQARRGARPRGDQVTNS
jgi:hypothetical protein